MLFQHGWARVERIPAGVIICEAREEMESGARVVGGLEAVEEEGKGQGDEAMDEAGEVGRRAL